MLGRLLGGRLGSYATSTAPLAPTPVAAAYTSKPRTKFMPPINAQTSGVYILQDPLVNKGPGFPHAERDRLDIRGLLPPRSFTMEEQIERFIRGYDKLSSDMVKHMTLMSLQDRNETLYYRVLIENITTMAPIVYTPVVGWACQNFGNNFRRARGLYFSARDRGEMHAMIHNWPAERVDVVVVTDGSRILGLGDLGAHGMGIPIGKLSLYIAAAGIHPANVLPITLDVGTNNEELLADPLYLGLPHRRLEGEAYLSLVDEMMSALQMRYPGALIQFEDFRSNYALTLLNRYRDIYTCFNDDIQGTGAVAAAGVMSAIQVRGDPIESLKNERIVCAGAGSAGVGVCMGIMHSMEAMGLSRDEAYKRFYMLDQNGLLTKERSELMYGQDGFARDDMEADLDLLEVVKQVKPTILLGVSGAPGIFTDEVLHAMGDGVHRPIVFPMSNPTSKAECKPEAAIRCTQGRVIMGSGSPFDPVEYEGKTHYISQANNMYIFPGLGLGSVATGALKITDGMIHAAASALVECMGTIDPEDQKLGKIFPDLEDIRTVSHIVATAVARQAYKENTATVEPPIDMTLSDWIKGLMYFPDYAPIVPYNITSHSINHTGATRRAPLQRPSHLLHLEEEEGF